MDLSRGVFTEIFTMRHEIGYWLKPASPKDVKDELTKLRRGLVELNKVYQSADSSVAKTLAARNFFTDETEATIKGLNRRISILHREDFEAWYSEAMDRVIKIAHERLTLLHPNVNKHPRSLAHYMQDTAELNENFLEFISPHAMDRAFFRWRVFEVMLNESKNEWCFVFTEAYRSISKLMIDFTEHKPHKLTRCLEYAFRKLLGDYRQGSEAKGHFDKDYGWNVDRGDMLVPREEMVACFKSFRRI